MSSDHENTRIISIEGNIGTGKSTFIKTLQQRFAEDASIIFLQEPVSEWNAIKDENGTTILERYYADQQKFAFPFQMMAYISRIALLREALRKKPRVIITERSVMTDKWVFASMLKDDKKIDEIGYAIYNRWFEEFLTDLPIFTHVYLRCEPTVSAKRVQKRNRKGEDIPLEYLERCHVYHDNWLLNNNNDNIKNKNTTSLCLAAGGDIEKEPNAMECCYQAVSELIMNDTIQKDTVYSPPSTMYRLMFDGASRGNPGPASTGYIIYLGDCEVKRGGSYLNDGTHTNNYAEYMAFIQGLEAISTLNPGASRIHIQGDSKLVIEQVQDNYKVNSEGLKPLYLKAKSILNSLTAKVTFQHIKRNANKIADKIANDVLDKKLVDFSHDSMHVSC